MGETEQVLRCRAGRRDRVTPCITVVISEDVAVRDRTADDNEEAWDQGVWDREGVIINKEKQ